MADRTDRVDEALRLALTDLPMALADLHRRLEVGGRLDATVAVVDGDRGAAHEPTELQARVQTVAEAAGFAVDRLGPAPASGAHAGTLRLEATARLALPDHVGAGMRLLCCGLNPSVHAAEAGVGYVTGSNRFWRAMAAAGLATRDRDPRHLLLHDRIGMTDLVKRPTPRAADLAPAEYREGVERLNALCRWLRPRALAVVGLAGWRAAVDPRTAPGWQPRPLGPTPVYVLPSTSGLNAGTSLDGLVEHLRTAADGPA